MDLSSTLIRIHYLPQHPICSVIEQARTSSHQLEIKIAISSHTNLWENGSANCAVKGWDWNNIDCHCIVFYEISGRYHYLFKQDFGSLQVMEYEDQRCSRLFLPELKRHRNCWKTTIQLQQLINKKLVRLSLSPSWSAHVGDFSKAAISVYLHSTSKFPSNLHPFVPYV